jgi:transcriptional regulator with XRE-family HTH domain
MLLEPRELVLAIKATGLTQKQIEDQTGIPQSTISKIERGESKDILSRNYRALVELHGRQRATVEVGA